MFRVTRTPDESSPRAGARRSLVALAAALALAAAGVLVGPASPASAGSAWPKLTFAAPVVSGTTATVVFTVDRPAKSILVGACLLTLPRKLPKAVSCGTQTTTATSTTFTTTLRGLPIGSSSFSVAGILRDGLVAGTTKITVAANATPTAVADAFQTAEDTAITLDVLANDTDADGDPLAVTLTQPPARGAAVVNPDGTIAYTPAANHHGADQLAYRVDDGKGGTSAATVSLDITPVNDAPVAVDDEFFVGENQGYVNLRLDTNDTDADHDILFYTSSDVWVDAHGVYSFNSETWMPGTTRTFTYTVDDRNGGTDEATVTITVFPQPDPPVGVLDSYTTPEDTPLTVAAPGVLANDSDPDPGDTLTATPSRDPQHGTWTLSLDGALTYTPDADFNGVDVAAYTLRDGYAPVSVVVSFYVSPVNDGPSAGDDGPFTVPAGAAREIDIATLLANDTDADGDALSVTGVTAGTGGSPALAGGTVTFTADACFDGEASFAYTVDDGQGGTATGTVAMNVVGAGPGVNTAPNAVDDAYTLDEDTAFAATGATDPLVNDTDPDPCTTLAIGDIRVGPDAPAGGTLEQVDGVWRYAPPQEFSGTVRLLYRATDGVLLSPVRVITLTFRAVNDAPVAGADVPQFATAGVPHVIPASALLANDSDADGPFSVTAVAPAAGSSGITVSLAGDQITVLADSGFVGWSGFTYTLDDGAGGVTVSPIVPVSVASAAPPSTQLRDACPNVAMSGFVRLYNEGSTMQICTFSTPQFGNDPAGTSTIQQALDAERARIGTSACPGDRVQLSGETWYGLDGGPADGIHAVISVACVLPGAAGEPDVCRFGGGVPSGIGDDFVCGPPAEPESAPEFVPDRAFCEALSVGRPDDPRWDQYEDVCRKILDG